MKTLRIIILAGIACIGISMNSCKHEPELPLTDQICFDNQVMPIINTSCATSDCHGGGGEAPRFSKYEDLVPKFVKAFKPMESKLHNVMVGHPNLPNFMPPSNSAFKISSEQIDIINLWILQGANNYICDTVPCDTITVTFNGTILPITNSYCVSCHSGVNPSGGISLIDHTTIKAAVESGRFVGAIEFLPGYKAMPYKSTQLIQCKIDQINKWINDQMPNN